MKRRLSFGLVAATTGALSTLFSPSAQAGTFDASGVYHLDESAAVAWDFSTMPARFVPSGVNKRCAEPMFEAATSTSALSGDDVVRVDTARGCEERFVIELPATSRSYRASLWMRHGSLNARVTAEYPGDSGVTTGAVRLFPTGRTTSDGWVELASNELSIQGLASRIVTLRLASFAAEDATEIDAFELFESGTFEPQRTCSGLADPACGPDESCVYGVCNVGRVSVPTLPPDGLRDDVVDMFASRLRVFFGGKKTREEDLPKALAILEEARHAKTAWAFWNGFARAVRTLHDAHTSPGIPLTGISQTRRLNACFFEGEADRSQDTWPKDPRYLDLIVSHAGPVAAGLLPGDRLVAIDGLHPFDWAQSLIDVDYTYHVASDSDVFAELAERLGGPSWYGSALIARYATTLTVIRCDAASDTCSSVPETILVSSLSNDGTGSDVVCDNRPFYHLEMEKPPDETTHYIFGSFFRGPILGTTPEEAIFGMVWDTLYGGGDPNGHVNSNILTAIDEWKQTARGVILDHRAGNGGTLDAAEYVTTLVRAPETIAVVRMPMTIGGFDGPSDAAEGLAIYQAHKGTAGYNVGSIDHDPLLPVALLIHRDVSASDFMPYGMKGAPNTRLFGPHATAGGFSTFINFEYYNGISWQVASGETIGSDGQALIGHGVEPDEIVLPRQSDLLAGKDSIHEAALAWLRGRLK